jgi:5-formyltetrahydrofolate cyclo-ligase
MQTPPAMAAPHFPSMSLDEALDAAKAAARKAAAGRRIGQNPALGDRLAALLLRENIVPPEATVAGFWPIQDEIDIRPLLAALHARGHPIALPVTGRRGEALVFRRWRPGETLLPGRFGTSHPAGAAVTPDVLLIPLLAFDGQGNRLGYGGGFYDRTIADLPAAIRIGCAFAVQELDSVPVGLYDQRLHAVLTETGLRLFPPPL